MDPRKVDSPQDKWRLQEILFTNYGDSDVEAREGNWSIVCGLGKSRNTTQTVAWRNHEA